MRKRERRNRLEEEEKKEEELKKGEEPPKPVIERKYHIPDRFEDWKTFSWPEEIMAGIKDNQTDFNLLS